ncbi:MAG: toxin-antitoxin system protein [Acidimicrobiales bacterium]|nr:MAG: toxin-antitoxin system protein [Acidimicrobiales bacterium]
MTTTKGDRLELRVSATDRTLIENAAIRLRESISDFTRGAAVRRAERVLARSNDTLMPEEQFDALLHSLDQPDDAPALARAFAQPRKFSRG